jgi:hypothetical protein
MATDEEPGPQGSLRQKNGLGYQSDRRFLASLGDNGELHFAFLDIEDCIRRVPLREYHLFFWNGHVLSTLTNRGEESNGVDLTVFFAGKTEFIDADYSARKGRRSTGQRNSGTGPALAALM